VKPGTWIRDTGFRIQDPEPGPFRLYARVVKTNTHTHTHPTRVALIEWAAHVGGAEG